MPDIGLPEGATIAYYAKSGAIPNGWAICDGTNNTPDLRGRFVRGVDALAEVGGSGGKESNTFTVGQDGRKSSDFHWGDTPWAPGPNPARGDQSFNLDNRPPYFDLIFLMKL